MVFSDLDGTVLDGRTVRRAQGLPLVLCSGTARRGLDLWRDRFGIGSPFIPAAAPGVPEMMLAAVAGRRGALAMRRGR